ncbi:hypothetical protein VA596_32565 [Amycolatopsis sp., V23-08]|uniref:Uncharacterized protein n=1 Tax=Amycolatopsis heterodermiae TaxID=3110235 RepID=A0ABU5RDG0_9PSEU|nr:hypothetical protein [Amycolatopsis sp., V23-08]MEA5364302.1 hypothetical protein [Amycolatopsis sp., V23-08]
MMSAIRRADQNCGSGGDHGVIGSCTSTSNEGNAETYASVYAAAAE